MFQRLRNLRRQFYAWRQRRPIQRLGMVALLSIVWPVRIAILSLLNILSRTQTPRRMVVIQLAGLGDMLMLTPALAGLQNQYPKAKIDLITLHGYVRDAFQNHPRLNTISMLSAYSGQWIISKFVNRPSAGLVLAVSWYYPNLLLKNLFSRYDVGINFALSDFDRNLGNALLRCLSVRRRVGSFGPSDGMLTDRLAVDYARTHRAIAYVELLRPLGISGQSRAYEFPVAKIDLDSVKLALRRERIDNSKPLAVIHPGGKVHINSRRWPAEYYARVCEFLSDSEGFEIVLTGDDDDVDVCEQITRHLGTKAKSVAGRFTFRETAALLSASQLCITNDTSTLHLAEAVQVARVISIFGPSDANLLAPQSERHIVLRSNLECAPCMGGIIDANTERCWREVKEECLSGITPELAISVLKQHYAKPTLRVASA
ncbi:MAG TPA: glycosyltransferase family 9 protein [Pyrinomonadaceae bacterium]|nr:glycosyltransferase family 9 protein [Pyrinomonadaceae bacterium]